MRIISLVFVLLLISQITSAQVVNEVFPAPDEGPEWIEIYNNTDNSINLSNYTISDLVKTVEIENIQILSFSYAVLTPNKQEFLKLWEVDPNIVFEIDLPTLNNTSDAVILKDENGNLIDSTFYDMSWGEKGKSLERIDSEKVALDNSNWSMPKNDIIGTPGIINTNSEPAVTQEINRGDVVLNEIMYDIDDNCGEYVELFNMTDEPINLKDFILFDESGSVEKGFKIEVDMFIEPADYLVLTWDEEFFIKYPELIDNAKVYYDKNSLALNKSGDMVIIADNFGNTIDSVYYSNDWHLDDLINTKNISLEKINPAALGYLSRSWSSSASSTGSSPTEANSLFYDVRKEGKLSASPNPFSPYSTHSDANCTITFKSPFDQAIIRAIIYDTNGNQIMELANNEYKGAVSTLIWNGRDNSGNIMPVGAYILNVEATDVSSSNTFRDKILLVIGN